MITPQQIAQYHDEGFTVLHECLSRAADAFPIHLNVRSDAQEAHTRLVRGHEQAEARFSLTSFPMPRFPRDTKSLYELREMARKEMAART